MFYLVGAGVIAQQHARVVRKLFPSAEIAVFDPNEEAAKRLAEGVPGCTFARDLNDLLDRPASPDDVVIVASPPFAHLDSVLAALGSGRHVLCEKPLALHTEDARRILSEARRAGRHFACCSTRFVGRGTQRRVRELLSEGSLGEVYKLTHVQRQNRARCGVEYQPQSAWFHDPQKSGGGVLMDWGPYDFALFWELFRSAKLDVLCSTLATCQTSADPFPLVTEQHVAATLRVWPDDGAPLIIEYERAACTHGQERRVSEIEGTRGAVRWDWLDWEGDSLTRAMDRDGKVYEVSETHETPLADAHARPLYEFMSFLRGENPTAIVDDIAVFNLACLRAVYDAARLGQPVTVERSGFGGNQE